MSEKPNKVFEVKKWNAVALWSNHSINNENRLEYLG